MGGWHWVGTEINEGLFFIALRLIHINSQKNNMLKAIWEERHQQSSRKDRPYLKDSTPSIKTVSEKKQDRDKESGRTN